MEHVAGFDPVIAGPRSEDASREALRIAAYGANQPDRTCPARRV